MAPDGKPLKVTVTSIRLGVRFRRPMEYSLSLGTLGLRSMIQMISTRPLHRVVVWA
jgi:hypothetical protein